MMKNRCLGSRESASGGAGERRGVAAGSGSPHSLVLGQATFQERIVADTFLQ